MSLSLKEGKKLIKEFISENFIRGHEVYSRFNLLNYSVNEAKIKGLFLEFGVRDGISLKFLAECRPDKRFYGFDSFKGLPEGWGNIYPKGWLKVDQPPHISGDVILIEGLFQDTLELFLEDHPEPVSFLHMDADIYSSTNYVLSTLADAGRIVKGTIIEFDEVFRQAHQKVLYDEYRAYKDFVEKYDVKVRWLKYFQIKGNICFLRYFRWKKRRASIIASLIVESFQKRRVKV